MLRQKNSTTPLRVSELVAYLQTLPPDAIVVQSHDSEGNNFSPTHEIGACDYQPDTNDLWVGAEPPSNVQRAVCFWPIH